MKTKLLTFILVLLTIYSYGQIRFEKGYVINNDNKRIECLIKNSDWKDNPSEIYFKTINSEIVEVGNVSSIKEFGIYGYSKYVMANVQIDRSSDNIEMLTTSKEPNWSQEQLFLKVILEGKASLYSYEEDNLKRFFYSSNNGVIMQLIYKQYLVDNIYITYNNKFRQQLWNDVKCSNTSANSIERINYSFKDLTKYFSLYSQCFGDSVVKYDKKSTSRKEFLNFKITPGINIASFSATNGYYRAKNFEVKNNLSLRIGFESEYILPINMNKWGLIFEPTFQYFNSKININDVTATVKYHSVEFPIGVRYYSFINNNLKMFFNGFYISNVNVIFNSKINFTKTFVDKTYDLNALDISTSSSLAFGAGVEHKRVSAEVRYYLSQNLLSKYQFWSSDYERLSVIIGCKLIKIRHK